MEPGQPMSAEELRAELERTYDVDDRAALMRAAAQLQNAGEWPWPFPTLHRMRGCTCE
jgi:hypothetical protein